VIGTLIVTPCPFRLAIVADQSSALEQYAMKEILVRDFA